MAELADAADSKSAGLRPMRVQVPLPAPILFSYLGASFPASKQVSQIVQMPGAEFFRLCSLAVLESRVYAHVEPMAELWSLRGLSCRELAGRTCRRSWEDEVFGQAARLTFYYFLGIFPALLLLLVVLNTFASI